MGEQCLAEAGHALEQQVAVRQQHADDALDHLVLADEGLVDLGLQLGEDLAKALGLLLGVGGWRREWRYLSSSASFRCVVMFGMVLNQVIARAAPSWRAAGW